MSGAGNRSGGFSALRTGTQLKRRNTFFWGNEYTPSFFQYFCFSCVTAWRGQQGQTPGIGQCLFRGTKKNVCVRCKADVSVHASSRVSQCILIMTGSGDPAVGQSRFQDSSCVEIHDKLIVGCNSVNGCEKLLTGHGATARIRAPRTSKETLCAFQYL